MSPPYEPAAERYDTMHYRRCGQSGLKLPAVSLGLWHNFGEGDDQVAARQMVLGAFDLGVTHFDLANNYGPPPGSAETTFGRIMASGLGPYRDELIVSSKAGYDMWPGPYGEWGSRKYMIASADQSLHRTGLDYFDIFYSHRFDPDTPLEETMGALDTLVRHGKALYAGISSYSAADTARAAAILADLGTPCVIHQPSYSIVNRWIEPDLLDTLDDLGIGSIVFSPLAQGLLTSKYLSGVPADSRAGRDGRFLSAAQVTGAAQKMASQLIAIASGRGQTLAQLAIAWVLRGERVTSALIGASRLDQITECVGALSHLDFDGDELAEIDRIAAEFAAASTVSA